MPLTQVQSGMMDSTAQYYSFKNRIINGNMVIDQRNAGAALTINATVNGNPYTLDRWRVGFFGSTYSATTATVQQVSDAPVGFVNSLKITSASTITPDANKLGSFFVQNIEGFNVADLGFGTAGASAITISFWVKASKTGVMSVSLENAATNRTYLTTVSISAVNTWEYKTVTIAGDTSGTWEKGNSVGIAVGFGLMSNGSWLAGTGGSWSSTRTLLSTSQTNFVAASGDNVSITGVQLEKGSTATSFDYRPYSTELQLCQRYFQTFVEPRLRGVAAGSLQLNRMGMPLITTMRSSPTCSISGTLSWYDGAGTGEITAISTQYSTISSIEFDFVPSTGSTVTNRPIVIYIRSISGSISASSEF